MTSDFVKQVHLETARRYQQQGHDIDYLVSHFQKVALDENDIAELLSQMQGAVTDNYRQD
jgi:predicted site-specific integrase-resolvase